MSGDHQAALATAVFGDAYPTAVRYAEILADRGIEWGLLGPREAERLWDRHLLNSAAVVGLIPAGAEVVDVGSGAGLPGIPVALARPDLSITLLEPLLRRATFLTETLDDLGLGARVRVVRERAEQHRQVYDIATSRALAPVDRLVRWCWPRVHQAGAVLAIKGRSAPEELAHHAVQLERAGLRGEVLLARAHPEASPTSVLRLTAR